MKRDHNKSKDEAVEANPPSVAQPAEVKPVMVAKPVEWITAAKKDLMGMALRVRMDLSQTLKAVQYGEMPDAVGPFEGSKGNNILKISSDYDKDTYRLVFAAKFEKAIYVLHVFKKKSKSGISAPKADIETVRLRYIEAEKHYRAKYETKE